MGNRAGVLVCLVHCAGTENLTFARSDPEVYRYPAKSTVKEKSTE